MRTPDEKNLRLEIWTDFMCPLCYIAKTNLENALDEFQDKDNVEVIYRPFQLFPHAPSNTGKGYYEYTSMTHGGLSIDYIKQGNKNVIALAKTVGLNYNLDILIPTNTSKALRIGLFAREKGKEKEWSDKIYKAYLIDGQDIGSTEVLVRFGLDIGLNGQDIQDIAESDTYKSELDAERQYGISIGITGTPFFYLNNKHRISGVQSKESLLAVMKDMLFA